MRSVFTIHHATRLWLQSSFHIPCHVEQIKIYTEHVVKMVTNIFTNLISALGVFFNVAALSALCSWNAGVRTFHDGVFRPLRYHIGHSRHWTMYSE